MLQTRTTLLNTRWLDVFIACNETQLQMTVEPVDHLRPLNDHGRYQVRLPCAVSDTNHCSTQLTIVRHRRLQE